MNAREAARGQTALMWAAAENNTVGDRGARRGWRRREAPAPPGSSRALLFAVRAGHVPAATALLDRGRGRRGPPARRHERAGAGDLQRALRTRLGAARSRRRPERVRAGLERAAPGGVVAPSEPRLQPAGCGAHGQPRQPGSRAQARGQGRRPQRTHDEGAARRQPQHAEPHRLHAVPRWRPRAPTCR